MRELLLRRRRAHGVVVQILATRLHGGGALVVEAGSRCATKMVVESLRQLLARVAAAMVMEGDDEKLGLGFHFGRW